MNYYICFNKADPSWLPLVEDLDKILIASKHKPMHILINTKSIDNTREFREQYAKECVEAMRNSDAFIFAFSDSIEESIEFGFGIGLASMRPGIILVAWAPSGTDIHLCDEKAFLDHPDVTVVKGSAAACAAELIPRLRKEQEKYATNNY